MQIIRVTKENYHLFDNMVYWRINGEERKEVNIESRCSEQIQKEIDSPNFYVYAVLFEKKMVGWISLIYMPKLGKYNGRGHIYVDELWVQPSYRGRGFAKGLMKKADELLIEKNAVGIRLYVRTDNLSANGLYQKCGYKINSKAYFMEK